MAFFEAFRNLCDIKRPSDFILSPGKAIHYVLDKKLRHEASVIFEESDGEELLKMAGLTGGWGRDVNRGIMLGEHRFRANFFFESGVRKVAMRLLPKSVAAPEALRIPKQVIAAATQHDSGVVLFSGLMGSGKSTSLASLLQVRSLSRDEHIVSLEDPIEYEFTSRFPLQFSQRCVGEDVASYAVGMKSAMRQRAMTILVQEIVDNESALAAIDATTTGHFILATVHASRAANLLASFMKFIPPERYAQVQAVFPQSFRAAVCQQLLPRADGKGLVAVHEVVMPAPAISTFISQGKFENINGELETGVKFGHMSFQMSIKTALAERLITNEVANSAIASIEGRSVLGNAR